MWVKINITAFFISGDLINNLLFKIFNILNKCVDHATHTKVKHLSNMLNPLAVTQDSLGAH